MKKIKDCKKFYCIFICFFLLEIININNENEKCH